MSPDLEAPAGVEAFLEESARSRGWIVNLYAQLEFMLADLALKVELFDAYAAVPRGLPFRFDSRVTRLEALLAVDGPLTPWAEMLRQIAHTAIAVQDIRHLMTHGLGQVHIVDGVFHLHLRRFDPTAEDPRRVVSAQFTGRSSPGDGVHCQIGVAGGHGDVSGNLPALGPRAAPRGRRGMTTLRHPTDQLPVVPRFEWQRWSTLFTDNRASSVEP